MESHDGTGLALRAVGLDHLAAQGEPLAPIGLDESPTIVGVDIRLDDEDTLDLGGREEVGHGSTG